MKDYVSLTVRIDRDTHTKFKIKAIEHGNLKLGKLLRAMILLYLEDEAYRSRIHEIYKQIR